VTGQRSVVPLEADTAKRVSFINNMKHSLNGHRLHFGRTEVRNKVLYIGHVLRSAKSFSLPELIPMFVTTRR
jgi:hypothetical protein